MQRGRRCEWIIATPAIWFRVTSVLAPSAWPLALRSAGRVLPAGRSAKTCALVISKRVREHFRRPVIEAECEHSAVGRLHPKQPIARLSIPTARDGLDRTQ